jgi:hypothetical protein
MIDQELINLIKNNSETKKEQDAIIIQLENSNVLAIKIFKMLVNPEHNIITLAVLLDKLNGIIHNHMYNEEMEKIINETK